MRKKLSITLNENTLRDIDAIIDNIFIRNRSQAIESLINNSLSEKKIAVILCGGDEKQLSIGMKYRPTINFGTNTVIEHAIKKLKDNGFRDIFVVSRGHILTQIFNILKDGTEHGISINYIEEKISEGSFDSLRYVSGKVKTHFLVVYGDLIFNKVNIDEIWNHHLRHNPISTIMMTTSSKPSEKGTLKVEGSKVLDFTQKPKQSDIYLVFSPIFVCEPEIFNYTGKSLENDIFPELSKKGLLEGHLSSEKEVHIHKLSDTYIN